MGWRAHGHARVNPNWPEAFAVCDRCYKLFNRVDLRNEMEWRGPRLMPTGYRVCRHCEDIPQQQFRPRILPPDPVPIIDPRPEFYDLDNGLRGFTMYTLDAPPFPVSSPYFYFDKPYVLTTEQAVSGIPVPAVTDFSGVIAASQVPQLLIPAYVQRAYILIFNPTFLPLAISFDSSTAFNANTSIVLNTGQSLIWSASQGVNLSANQLNITGFKPGQPYYAWATQVVVPATAGLFNDGGVLILVAPSGWPTSPTGLAPGALWNNGLTIDVVQGFTPISAPPIFFGQISSSALLLLGGAGIPTTPPLLQDDQIWSNSGELSVASALTNDGGWLVVDSSVNYPTSPIGLPNGALWSNGGVVGVVGTTTPNPSAPAVIFGSLSALQLLTLTGANLPLSDPNNPGQLWNNGGVVSIS